MPLAPWGNRSRKRTAPAAIAAPLSANVQFIVKCRGEQTGAPTSGSGSALHEVTPRTLTACCDGA